MITPSFSPTATERVLPKLALDFTTASLDSRVTFTRTTDATHPATYTNSSGIVTAATNNQPRFDYNPITLACKGLLIEESRTNLAIYSEDFYSWGKVRSTVSQNTTTAPDGTSNADTIIEDSSVSTTHFVANNFTYTAAAYTGTVYLKAKERTWAWLRVGPSALNINAYVNLATGVFGTIGAGTTASSITPAGNDWYRCSITGTVTAVADYGLMIFTATGNGGNSYTGNGTSGIYAWGAQLELGAFPTSYIPNLSTGTTTRNADVATMTGTNFSSWWNASEGTFVNWYILSDGYSTSLTPRVGLGVSDGTTSNRIRMYVSSATSVNTGIVTGGTTVASLDTTVSNITTTVNKTSVAYKADSFASSSNGGNPVTDSAGAVPTVDRAYIGSIETGTTSQLNGCVQKIFYWPQRLTNAEVQAISK